MQKKALKTPHIPAERHRRKSQAQYYIEYYIELYDYIAWWSRLPDPETHIYIAFGVSKYILKARDQCSKTTKYIIS